jgi:hypothetical protein
MHDNERCQALPRMVGQQAVCASEAMAPLQQCHVRHCGSQIRSCRSLPMGVSATFWCCEIQQCLPNAVSGRASQQCLTMQQLQVACKRQNDKILLCAHGTDSRHATVAFLGSQLSCR